MNVSNPVAMAEGFQDLSPLVLSESDDNPRYISPERLDDLKYNLQADPAMLRARPIICTEYGEVICGNMRLRAARELGWDSVPVFVHHFADNAEKRSWMLRDNQEFGDWVPDQLAAMIAEHVAEGADTKLLGFDDEEIMAAVRRATGDALVPEPSEPPTQQLAAEVVVEIRCSKQALSEIQETLEEWQVSIDELEIGVSS